MAEQTIMDLSLDSQAILQDAMASGEFDTREDIVAIALLEWKTSRLIEAAGADVFRRRWAEAILANGPYYTLEEVMGPIEQQYTLPIEPGTGA